MDTKEFLKEKKLLQDEEMVYKISLGEDSEIVLNDLLDEFAEKKGHDSYVRLYAEFENFKKRVQKEKSELILNTKIKTLNSILDLDSDLSIARKSISDSEGLNIILNKVSTFLKNEGIEEIQTETYDSDLHEVISILDTGEEKIIDVVSKGYTIDGKPFRYPKIILSK
jgi:molecular chaperone GrpE